MLKCESALTKHINYATDILHFVSYDSSSDDELHRQ